MITVVVSKDSIGNASHKLAANIAIFRAWGIGCRTVGVFRYRMDSIVNIDCAIFVDTETARIVGIRIVRTIYTGDLVERVVGISVQTIIDYVAISIVSEISEPIGSW